MVPSGMSSRSFLYGVHERGTGDGRVDPNAIYHRREAQLLNGMLEAG